MWLTIYHLSNQTSPSSTAKFSESLDVIKVDWVIDLGPGGGESGGPHRGPGHAGRYRQKPRLHHREVSKTSSFLTFVDGGEAYAVSHGVCH
ncbi:MAG: hypothetical protein AB7T38_04055 [Nitrospirales bacterium]